MKNLRLLSLVGITSIALTHAAWADPHGGGGGGFGGGGFGGGHAGGGQGAPGARGESPAKIAKALGVSRASIYRHLAAEGE